MKKSELPNEAFSRGLSDTVYPMTAESWVRLEIGQAVRSHGIVYVLVGENLLESRGHRRSVRYVSPERDDISEFFRWPWSDER